MIRRIAASAVTAYVILGLFVAGAFVRANQVNIDAQRNLCQAQVRIWNVVHATIEEQTVQVEPAEHADEALRQQLAIGNVRRAGQRVRLARIQGPRPEC